MTMRVVDEFERPLVPEETERELAAHFPYRDMSPEEYAARYAADIACFSLDERRYRSMRLDQWILRLGEILRDWDAVNECRRKYLTPEEHARALARDREDF
jgi:hypothetical protein